MSGVDIRNGKGSKFFGRVFRYSISFLGPTFVYNRMENERATSKPSIKGLFLSVFWYEASSDCQSKQFYSENFLQNLVDGKSFDFSVSALFHFFFGHPSMRVD